MIPPSLRAAFSALPFGAVHRLPKGQRIKLYKRLTGTKFTARRETPIECLERILGKDFNLCPCCKTGHPAREPPLAPAVAAALRHAN